MRVRDRISAILLVAPTVFSYAGMANAEESVETNIKFLNGDSVSREAKNTFYTQEHPENIHHAGDNYFYKFSNFDLNKQDTVVFDTGSSTSVQNIVALIVGNKSTIDGIIRLENGRNANLFLLNKNGVKFGKDATVDIDGKLYVSTASKLEFKGGGVFDSSTTVYSKLDKAPDTNSLTGILNLNQSFTGNSTAVTATPSAASTSGIGTSTPSTSSASGSSPTAGATSSSGSSSTQPSTSGNSPTGSNSPSATGTPGTSSASSTASPDGPGVSGGSTTQSTGSQTSGASKSSSKPSSASVPSGIYSRQFERLTMGEEYCALGEGSRLGLGGRGGLPPKGDDLIVY